MTAKLLKFTNPRPRFQVQPTSVDPSDTLAAVHRIKQEIDELTEEQSDAIKTATYVGRTPDEAKEYDDRRGRITNLIGQLEILEKAQ